MSNVKVSIVTVVYNGGTTIERTIQSVLAQSYPNIEYIVIDGKSTDNTMEVINKYKDRLQVISEYDSGIYNAMNKGLSRATGEIAGIINSGDWYEPEAVEIVVEAFLQNPSYSVFHGLLKRYNHKGELYSISGHHHSFLASGMIEHPTCFVTSGLYRRIGMFNESYSSAGDYEFMLKSLRNEARFLFSDKIIANFSMGGISASFKAAKETLSIRRKYKLISSFKQGILLLYFWFKSEG